MHFELPMGDGHYIISAFPLFAVMFAVVCALWARSTERSGWLWFFFALILPPIAFIALVLKSISAPPPPVPTDWSRKDLP